MATIVAADDDPDILDLIAFKLRAAGHEVALAADGVEALVAIARHSPDLVVLDLGMPRLNGVEVLEALREDPATRELPVLVVSAYSDATRVERCRQLGATAYVSKPFSPRALVTQVAEVLTATATGRQAPAEDARPA